MSLGTCAICTESQAKYRCPTCSVVYCSLPCFKNEKHSHDRKAQLDSQTKASDQSIEVISNHASEEKALNASNPAPEQTIFETIAHDPVVKSLLQYKSLQVHLSILLKLLSDSSLTREPIFENRKEIVNMRLCELRIGGQEENELVEEFVQRVLFVMAQKTEQSV